MRNFLIAIFLLIAPLCATATTVYTNTDDNQNITYSDTPIENGKTLEVPSSTTNVTTDKNTPPPQQASSSQQTKEDVARKPYTTFIISTPQDQQTFQNQRTIPINVKIEPELQESDKVQLYVDGSPYGPETTPTNLVLQQLDRGMHQVSVALIDKNKAILRKTNTITLYIMYAHLGGT